MSGNNFSMYKQEKHFKKSVFFSGNDALREGYALCYDRDYGTASAADAGRFIRVEKPAAANLRHFAGIVAGAYRARTGGQYVDIIQPTRGAFNCHTDQNCSQGSTLLTVKPDSFALGGMGEGPIVAEAIQTIDRSSTAGSVQAVLVGTDELGTGSGLWATCPWDWINRDPSRGYTFHDDFQHWDDTDNWVKTQATAGTAEFLSGGEGGLLELDSGSSTADQGIQVQRTANVITPAAGKTIWFECRLAVTDTVDKAQIFAGLATVDTSLFASGENSTDNHIGFEMGATVQGGASAGKLQFYGEKATARGTVADVHPLVDNIFVRLGFLVLGVTAVKVFVNGTQVGTLATANIPVTALVPSMACLSEGTNDPIVYADYVRGAVAYSR